LTQHGVRNRIDSLTPRATILEPPRPNRIVSLTATVLCPALESSLIPIPRWSQLAAIGWKRELASDTEIVSAAIDGDQERRPRRPRSGSERTITRADAASCLRPRSSPTAAPVVGVDRAHPTPLRVFDRYVLTPHYDLTPSDVETVSKRTTYDPLLQEHRRNRDRVVEPVLNSAVPSAVGDRDRVLDWTTYESRFCRARCRTPIESSSWIETLLRETVSDTVSIVNWTVRSRFLASTLSDTAIESSSWTGTALVLWTALSIPRSCLERARVHPLFAGHAVGDRDVSDSIDCDFCCHAIGRRDRSRASARTS